MEWLEPDNQGGFASGTNGLVRTRRYHALLLTATIPPTGRVVLVNGVEAWVDTPAGQTFLSAQHYAPDTLYPDGATHIASFTHDPWPTWTFALPGGVSLRQEILVDPDAGETLLRWQLTAPANSPCSLSVRPLLSERDYHSLHRENAAFDFAATVHAGNVTWRPYASLPAIAGLTNGTYAHAPEWYRDFLYTEERDRGLDCIEDLASPGTFTFDLAQGEAVMILRAGDGLSVRAAARAARLVETERTHRTGEALARAAGAYFADRGRGQTLIAGFPWFTDWGRDTFIALRGLALGTGRVREAAAILSEWAGTVSEGMLPNRFPDASGPPEYNAVDASLWFIIAVHDLLATGGSVDRARLLGAVEAILTGYAAGTRFNIGADTDGLLRSGVPGVQLTWMDAKVGDHVITPRIGKPVEVQALWINALRIGAASSPRWAELAERAQSAFTGRFPDPATGGLLDVVDAEHAAGRTRAQIRPNQILAVGGLPFPILTGDAARRVVDLVEARLLTPLGLRTLDPADPAYIGHYRGGPAERDGAYHEGTAWPWLMGPFVQAWLRVRGETAAAKAEAKGRFLPPLLAHLAEAGLGHVSEVVDGDAPHTPGGCPFQAWSLGELIRIRAMLGET